MRPSPVPAVTQSFPSIPSSAGRMGKGRKEPQVPARGKEGEGKRDQLITAPGFFLLSSSTHISLLLILLPSLGPPSALPRKDGKKNTFH